MTVRAYFCLEALVEEGTGGPCHPSLPQEVASAIISAKTMVSTRKPFTTTIMKELGNVFKRSLFPAFARPRPFPADVGLGVLVEGVLNEVSSLPQRAPFPTAVGSK